MGGRPGQTQEAWSLDDVDYHTQVTEDQFEKIKNVQSEGAYVYGLDLESARWYKNSLDDPNEKKMFYPLPILYVTAIQKKKGPGDDRASSGSVYNCPVYKYAKRTDRYIIFRVKLNCEGNHDAKFWKLRGVALLCFTEL
mmetsp:Transcript_28828/g.26118  ORF Transcript_28828/g.26118 Transcript_28828/m.26118 type:complete len:139 (-) Transcript_28828:156-572(-)